MLVVTKAKIEDVDQILQLYNEYDKEIENCFPEKHLKLLKELHPQYEDKSDRKNGIKNTINDKNQLLLIAKEDETILGCVVGYTEGVQGKFDQLTLSSKSQDQDILKKLYRELEQWFKSQGCRYIEVDVVFGNPRKKIYNEFGFETVIEEMRKII